MAHSLGRVLVTNRDGRTMFTMQIIRDVAGEGTQSCIDRAVRKARGMFISSRPYDFQIELEEPYLDF